MLTSKSVKTVIFIIYTIDKKNQCAILIYIREREKLQKGYKMHIYKVYDMENKAIIFNSLSELRMFLDLSVKDVKKCFYPGVHTTEYGFEVITY